MVSELFQKDKFANLWKPIHDNIIIPVSSDPLRLETVERKGKITTKVLSREQKYIFRWNKKHFFIICKMLSFGKVKQKKPENRGQKIKWKKYFIALHEEMFYCSLCSFLKVNRFRHKSFESLEAQLWNTLPDITKYRSCLPEVFL